MLWETVIELLRATIFSVAQVFNGNLGLAACVVSFGMRLLLLPITLPLARRALAHQRRLLAFRPQIERIRKRYANDPLRQAREIAAFYERRGEKQVDSAGLYGALVQTPFLAGLYAALRRGVGDGVRFLWIGDLARPSVIVTVVVAVLSMAAMVAAPSADPARRLSWVSLLLTAGITFWFLSSNSAVFALASGAGVLVNGVQGLLLRRERSRPSTT